MTFYHGTSGKHLNDQIEYILCAAWKRKSPRVVEGNPYRVPNDILNIEIGYRHHDIWSRFGNELSTEEGSDGFYTSKGRFVSRTEGMEIAFKCGQVKRNPIWTAEEVHDSLLPLSEEYIGNYKPLASEDLYTCSPDGNHMNE